MKAFLAAAAMAIAFGSAAYADDMTFYMKHNSQTGIAIEFFSQDRNQVWPGNDKVYFLDKGEKKSVTVECQAGENICYGAWVAGDDSVWWGVGPDNDKKCDTCCRICVDGATETVSIGSEQ